MVQEAGLSLLTGSLQGDDINEDLLKDCLIVPVIDKIGSILQCMMTMMVKR